MKDKLQTGFKVTLRNGMVGVVAEMTEYTIMLFSEIMLNYTTDYEGLENLYSSEFDIVEIHKKDSIKPYLTFYEIEPDDVRVL